MVTKVCLFCRLGLEIYHELDFMLRTTQNYSGSFRKLTVQVNKDELREFIVGKQLEHASDRANAEKLTAPPSPTSPADANAPPFPEDMA